MVSITTPKVKLNSGNSIPVLGLGVYLAPKAETKSLVISALEKGYKHIDTASFYNNEAEVAGAISEWISSNPESNKRTDVWYTTKIFDADHGYEKATKAIKLALEKASSIGYIDLILIHSPQSNYQLRHETWLALQEAVLAGTVKNIGVSNYGVKHIEEMLAYPDLTIKPSVNQIELHPWLRRPELIEYLQSKDIAIEAYSPLARAFKVGEPSITEIATKHDITNAQVLIAWSLKKGFIPLPKTANVDRLLPNLESLGVVLDDEDMKALDGLDEGFISVPQWNPVNYPLDNEK